MPNMYNITGKQTRIVTRTKIKTFTWHGGVSDNSCQRESSLDFYSDANWVSYVIQTTGPQRENSFRRANKELCFNGWVSSKWRFRDALLAARCRHLEFGEGALIWKIPKSVYREQNLLLDSTPKKRESRIHRWVEATPEMKTEKECVEIRVKPVHSAYLRCSRILSSSI